MIYCHIAINDGNITDYETEVFDAITEEIDNIFRKRFPNYQSSFSPAEADDESGNCGYTFLSQKIS